MRDAIFSTTEQVATSISPPVIMASISSISSDITTSLQSAGRLVHLATATAETAVPVVASSPRSWVGSVTSFLLFFLRVIPRILYWLIAFTTLTLPSWLFAIFSTSLTFTLNATTL